MGGVFKAIEAFERGQVQMGATPNSSETIMAHMRANHSAPEDIGRIAQEAGVTTLVLSHLGPSNASVSDAAWRTAVAQFFKCEIIVGHDLMVI